jgi:predicted Fe-Mo cluster-binding NifX family protein
MSIKVAVASEDQLNMGGHAGQCTNYFIYTVEDNGNYEKEFIQLAPNETLRYSFHTDKSEIPSNRLFDMDIIIITQIGLNGVNNLAKQGVKALLVKESIPTDEIINKLIDGSLEVYEAMPHDHGHHH